MTLKSMTGFARRTDSNDHFSWVWEVKSVNNKNLDARVRVPSLLDGFDITAKKTITSKITRGTVFANLSLSKEGDAASISVNEGKLEALLEVAQKYSTMDGVTPASIDGLLAVKGIVEESQDDLSEDDRAVLERALTESLNECLDALNAARGGEGARIQTVLDQQLSAIKDLAQKARSDNGDRLEAMHNRFKQQLEKLTGVKKPMDEERLAQEIAMLAVKADIMEELDRLDSHVIEAESLLSSTKAVGRRLDFMCQEFNREANTLCAKSGDTNLTKTGLEIKVLIDQFREQVQNIE
jgi:uncharacterized protein (TIGR00255 family)